MVYISKLTKRLALSRRVLVLTAFLAGCTEVPTQPEATARPSGTADVSTSWNPWIRVARVVVTPAIVPLKVGDEAALTATATSLSGTVLLGRRFTWRSSDTTVVHVTSEGRVKGLAIGSALVTALTGGKAGVAHVNVVTAPSAPAVAQIVITPATGSLMLGQTLTYGVVLRDAGGNVLTGRTITWTSANPTVATVTPTGIATALSTGTTTVRAASEGIVADASLSVVGLAAAQLQVSTQPGGAVAGSPLAPQPIVRILDASGQLMDASTRVVVSIASGPGTLGGTAGVDAVHGVATFSDLTISGGTGTHTLRFTAAGLPAISSAAVTITAPPVVPPPTGGSLLFSSDFATASGSSTTAMTDGGKWQWAWGGSCESNPAQCESRILADANFPSGRAFYSGYHGNKSSTGVPSAGGGNLLASNRWPVPAVGQTLFHRFYYRNTIRNEVGDLAIGGDHPYQGFGNNEGAVSGNCSVDWNFKFGPKANGTHSWVFFNAGRTWQKTGLPKFTTHLMEAAFTRVGTNSYVVRMRLNGVDISSSIGLPTTGMPIGDACLRTLFVGNNDPGYGSNTSDTDPTRWRNYNGSPKPGGPYADLDAYRWGAIAVTIRSDANAWIGPYTP